MIPVRVVLFVPAILILIYLITKDFFTLVELPNEEDTDV